MNTQEAIAHVLSLLDGPSIKETLAAKAAEATKAVSSYSILRTRRNYSMGVERLTQERAKVAKRRDELVAQYQLALSKVDAELSSLDQDISEAPDYMDKLRAAKAEAQRLSSEYKKLHAVAQLQTALNAMSADVLANLPTVEDVKE